MFSIFWLSDKLCPLQWFLHFTALITCFSGSLREYFTNSYFFLFETLQCQNTTTSSCHMVRGGPAPDPRYLYRYLRGDETTCPDGSNHRIAILKFLSLSDCRHYPLSNSCDDLVCVLTVAQSLYTAHPPNVFLKTMASFPWAAALILLSTPSMICIPSIRHC